MQFNLSWWQVAIGIGAIGLIAAIVVIVVVVTGDGDDTPAPEEARVTVEEVVNLVETDRPRGSDAVPGVFLGAELGQDLRAGDGVKTFQDSEARVDIVIRDSAQGWSNLSVGSPSGRGTAQGAQP